MSNTLMNLLEQVTDEKSFLRFFRALREACEKSEHDCEQRDEDCVSKEHWQTRSTKNFLKSMEAWAGGDFADGLHGGDPMLRRVATMLYVGRYLRHEDYPPR